MDQLSEQVMFVFAKTDSLLFVCDVRYTLAKTEITYYFSLSQSDLVDKLQTQTHWFQNKLFSFGNEMSSKKSRVRYSIWMSCLSNALTIYLYDLLQTRMKYQIHLEKSFKFTNFPWQSFLQDYRLDYQFHFLSSMEVEMWVLHLSPIDLTE